MLYQLSYVRAPGSLARGRGQASHADQAAGCRADSYTSTKRR